MPENNEETPAENSYERIRKLVSKGAGNDSGKYFDMLTSSEQELVRKFIVHLRTTTMTPASISSYKSYVTKMLLWERGALGRDLTNDEKSGARKFLAWHDEHEHNSEEE